MGGRFVRPAFCVKLSWCECVSVCLGIILPTLEDIKPGARLRRLEPAGIAEVVQVACFGADALNLVFRVEGRVGECLVYRGEETSFEFFEVGRTYAFNA